MKSKKILALVLIFIILFSVGCGRNKIEVVNISCLSFDENGDVIIPEGYIGFSVYGKEQELIVNYAFAKSDYKKNISVADLSRDICRELDIPIVFSGAGSMTYVQGINNLFEFDDGAESGWIYAVNGEFQSVGCGTYILQDCDYVEWRYTLDLGKDVGAYKLEE